MNDRTGVTVDATPAAPQHLNVANLTPQQRDGLACVRCGNSDQPMKPTGAIVDGVQLFVCTPCLAVEKINARIEGSELDEVRVDLAREELRLAYYMGILKGVTEPNITVDDLRTAAAEAIEDIHDKRCQHERAVQEEPTALFAAGYAACLRAITKASERLDITTAEIREFLDEVLTVAERERVGRLVAATLRLRAAKSTTR